MADAASRNDTISPERQVRGPSNGAAPVSFRIPVTWNSLITNLLPVHIGSGGAEEPGLVEYGWEESIAETEGPARWAMVVPKMDREASGS